MRVFSNINCPLKLKYAYICISISTNSLFSHVLRCTIHFNAHAYICTHVSDARTIYIMQIDFAEFCRGQSVTAAKHA